MEDLCMRILFLSIAVIIFTNNVLRAESSGSNTDTICEDQENKITLIKESYSKIYEALPKDADINCSNIKPYLDAVTKLVNSTESELPKDFNKCSFVDNIFVNLQNETIAYIGPKTPPQVIDPFNSQAQEQKETALLFLNKEEITNFCRHPNEEISYKNSLLFRSQVEKAMPSLTTALPSPVGVSPDAFINHLQAGLNNQFTTPGAISPYQQGISSQNNMGQASFYTGTNNVKFEGSQSPYMYTPK